MFSSWKTFLNKTLSIRTYLSVILGVFIFFIFYHAILWFTLTSKLLDLSSPYQVGDLARIGYQISSIHSRIRIDTLPKKHIEFPEWKGERIDVLTIGDSFSNGGGGGKNRYYQDYISSDHNLTVMNINPTLFGENSIEAVVALLSSGLLEEINPKAVLIESVGRYTLNRFAKPMNWNPKTTRQALFNDLKKGQWGDGKPKKEDISFISTANYKLPLYNFYYLFSDNAFDYSNAYKLSLTKPLFNVESDTTLLVYEHDITSLGGVRAKSVALMNENFNRLADLLASKNISLIYMIAVDKYDLYYPYIANNTYDNNSLFSLLRPMEKRYSFIDTKAILQKELAKGTKDIYFADDTHWSHLASKSIVQTYPFLKFSSQH